MPASSRVLLTVKLAGTTRAVLPSGDGSVPPPRANSAVPTKVAS
jgi:hypothetical protein